jgi:hypothetical protein
LGKGRSQKLFESLHARTVREMSLVHRSDDSEDETGVPRYRAHMDPKTIECQKALDKMRQDFNKRKLKVIAENEERAKRGLKPERVPNEEEDLFKSKEWIITENRLQCQP